MLLGGKLFKSESRGAAGDEEEEQEQEEDGAFRTGHTLVRALDTPERR